jgi:hypothetical protein
LFFIFISYNMHQQHLHQYMPGMQQQHYQPPPPPQYANWQRQGAGNGMPNPHHFQHHENMHNIPGAAQGGFNGGGAPPPPQQQQKQTFGGHGGKYVPPPPPPPILPRLWPKQQGEKGSDAKVTGDGKQEATDQVSLEDKIAKIKNALKEFHKDEL